jgi:hypothetical protein
VLEVAVVVPVVPATKALLIRFRCTPAMAETGVVLRSPDQSLLTAVAAVAELAKLVLAITAALALDLPVKAGTAVVALAAPSPQVHQTLEHQELPTLVAVVAVATAFGGITEMAVRVVLA